MITKPTPRLGSAELLAGYSKSDLIEMYDEAKYMCFACLLASDRANARKWASIANDCAVTLHALTGGHEV